jgi:ElaB/YqjD/DUF883 family membrane-anchored ribosome-binding protein
MKARSIDLDQSGSDPGWLQQFGFDKERHMATTSTEADIQALQAQIKELRADLASLTETLRDLARHGSAEATAKMRESGEKLWSEAKKKASGLAEEIEEKPVTAAVTAFSVGVLLGMIFSGRRG